MAKPQLTQDTFLEEFEDWDGTVGELFIIVKDLKAEHGNDKKIIVDAGYSNVSFMLDNSDVRAREQAEWDRLHPKKLNPAELQEHKNKLILQLLEHAGVKLTKKEIKERVHTGKGFDDLLKK